MMTSPVRPTYYTSLKVQNVRCFGNPQVLELTDQQGNPAQWTLLLGDNGTGKTTLLEALAWMKPQAKPPEQASPGDPSPFSEPVLTDAENDVLFDLLRAVGRPSTSSEETTLDIRATLITGLRIGGKSRGKPAEFESGITIKSVGGEIITDGVKNIGKPKIKPPEVFVVAYSAGRCLGFANLDQADLSEPESNLFAETPQLFDAEEVLLKLDYAALKHGGPAKTRLQKLKKLLADLLPDVPDEGAIKILGPPDPRRGSQEGGVTIKTPYGDVPLRLLSLGYRTVFAWAVDLAWRLFQQYPDSGSPLSEPAVVLLDEIDLHLHPRWQRQVMNYLTRHFPATQFVVTAHSPLVVQSGPAINVAVLRKQEGTQGTMEVSIDSDPERVDGWRVDQILTSEMFELPSARGLDFEKLVKRRDELLDKGKRTKEDEAELEKIEHKIEVLPSAERRSDQLDIDLIRRAASILRKKGYR